MIDEQVGIEANVAVAVCAVDGAPLRLVRAHNLVPLVPRQVIADLLDGIVGTSLVASHIGLGTGDTPPAAGDVALQAEVVRQAVTSRQNANALVTVTHFLAQDDQNGVTLHEAGLFTAAAAGILVARVVHDPIAKSAAITLTYTWTIAVNAGGS